MRGSVALAGASSSSSGPLFGDNRFDLSSEIPADLGTDAVGIASGTKYPIQGVSASDLGLYDSPIFKEAQSKLAYWRRREPFAILDEYHQKPLDPGVLFSSMISPAVLPVFSSASDANPVQKKLGMMIEAALQPYNIDGQVPVKESRALELGIYFLPVGETIALDLTTYSVVKQRYTWEDLRFLDEYRTLYHGTSLTGALAVLAQGWRPSITRSQSNYDKGQTETMQHSLQSWSDAKLSYSNQVGLTFATSRDKDPFGDTYQSEWWLSKAMDIHTGSLSARLTFKAPTHSHLLNLSSGSRKVNTQLGYLGEDAGNITTLEITRKGGSAERDRIIQEAWGAPGSNAKARHARQQSTRRLDAIWSQFPGLRKSYNFGRSDSPFAL